LYERFEKDFTAALVKLDILKKSEININSNSKDILIDFNQMKNLYLEMGFVNQNITNLETK